MAPAVSTIWFLIVVIFPILGPIGLLIYLAQRQKHSDNLYTVINRFLEAYSPLRMALGKLSLALCMLRE